MKEPVFWTCRFFCKINCFKIRFERTHTCFESMICCLKFNFNSKNRFLETSTFGSILMVTYVDFSLALRCYEIHSIGWIWVHKRIQHPLARANGGQKWRSTRVSCSYLAQKRSLYKIELKFWKFQAWLTHKPERHLDDQLKSCILFHASLWPWKIRFRMHKS